jgi:thymidylate synthase (FAD)
VADCEAAEATYQKYRELNWTPQQARYFLPNGIKTEFAATLNLGSWYNFFRKRTAAAAHPQMRQLAVPLLRHFQQHLPMIFDSIELPVLDYPEANLIVHSGCEPVDFEEVAIS